jgi:prepilin-type N-terminal cleavage/methylation domain-containing protein
LLLDRHLEPENAMKKQQGGFTLVEIAIVLVIIGLLLGGVLKGQELIVQAKIKNVTNDFNGIAAAIYGYQDRYKSFPGDDNKAADGSGTSTAKGRWGTNTANGDANGQVDGEFPSASDTDESRIFWQHLRLAGFVAGDSTSKAQPQNALGGIVGVQMSSGAAASPDLSGLVVCSSNLSGKVASAVDAQLDDGLTNRGSVRGYTQTGVVTPGATTNPTRSAAASGGAYTDDGATLYTLCKTL